MMQIQTLFLQKIQHFMEFHFKFFLNLMILNLLAYIYSIFYLLLFRVCFVLINFLIMIMVIDLLAVVVMVIFI